MSIKAMNWALEVQTGHALAKLILLAIANYADADGMCWPSNGRLSTDTEMSVPTVKRRIVELEALGVLTTFRCWMDENGVRNRNGLGRETSREIRLHMHRVINATSSSEEEENIRGGDQPESPPNSAEGGTQPESHGDHADLPGDSLRSPPCEPPSNQESPPSPPPGGRVADLDLEGLSEFRRDYPKSGTWMWSKVELLWAALTPEERIRCRAAVIPYAKETAKDRPPARRPDAWLKEQMWLGYPHAQFLAEPAPVPQRVWIGDADLGPLDFAFSIVGRGSAPRVRDDDRGLGLWRLGQLERDLLGLYSLVDRDRETWLQFAKGSSEFGAWATRLKSWTGYTPETVRHFTEPELPHHKLDVLNPRYRLRKSEQVLRVPCHWPPRKDGTIEGEG